MPFLSVAERGNGTVRYFVSILCVCVCVRACVCSYERACLCLRECGVFVCVFVYICVFVCVTETEGQRDRFSDGY